jgi:twitching motility protein PilT
MASMVNHINENYNRHIITIEDPIEYIHEHKRSIIEQKEI